MCVDVELIRTPATTTLSSNRARQQFRFKRFNILSNSLLLSRDSSKFNDEIFLKDLRRAEALERKSGWREGHLSSTRIDLEDCVEV